MSNQRSMLDEPGVEMACRGRGVHLSNLGRLRRGLGLGNKKCPRCENSDNQLSRKPVSFGSCGVGVFSINHC